MTFAAWRPSGSDARSFDWIISRMHLRVEPDTLRGMLFGVGLAALGFLAAGAGHGTYVLIGASSAPVGVLGIRAALAGAPIFWAVVGAAFDWLEKPWRNRLVTAVMLLH